MNSPWIYVVLTGVALIMLARLLPTQRVASASGDLQQHIEEVFDQFASMMEEENRELIMLVSNMRKQQEDEIKRLQQRISKMETELNSIPAFDQDTNLNERTIKLQRDDRIATNGYATNDNEQDHQPNESVAKMSKIRSRYTDLFALYDNGKSTDYIAKKLLMNRGEVMLILQLAQQEERLYG